MPDCDPKIINRMKHVPNEGLCAVQSRNNGGGGDFGRGIVLVLKVYGCILSQPSVSILPNKIPIHAHVITSHLSVLKGMKGTINSVE